MSTTTGHPETRWPRLLAGTPRAARPWLGLLAAGYVVLGDAATGIGGGFCSLNGILTAVIALVMGVSLIHLAGQAWRRPGAGDGWGPWLREAAAWPPTPYLIFFLCALSAVVRGGPPQVAVQQLSVYLIFVASIVLAAVGPGCPDAGRLLRWMSGAAWVTAAVYALTLLATGLNANLVYSARGFALVVVVLLPVSLARAGRGRGVARNVQPCLLLALVVLSLSRTALAVVVVQCVVWWISGRRGRRAILSAAAVVPVTSAAAYLLLSRFGPLYDRFFIGDLHRLPGSTPAADHGIGALLSRVPAVNLQGRSNMWMVVWDSAREHLWLGRGLGSASLTIQAQYPGLIQPHNDFLRLLHDTGLIGLGLWLLGALVIVVRLLDGIRRAPGSRTGTAAWAALVAFLGIGATMITDNSLVYSFVMLPLGTLIGAGLREGRQRAAAPADLRPSDGGREVVAVGGRSAG